MLGQRNRRRPTWSIFLAVVGLIGSYPLLRGDSVTPATAKKTVSGTGAALAPLSTGITQFPAPVDSVPQPPAAKSPKRKSPRINEQSAIKLVPARASNSNSDFYIHALNRESNKIGPGKASLALGPIRPSPLKEALSSKLRPAPLPQGGSGSPPNPPTSNLPADGATGVSTSPTLSVNVSDPSSSNLTVNFYGKLVPATPTGSSFSIIVLPDTQYYSSNLNNGTLAMFNSQTQWIVNNRSADNIAFVIGLGDIVQNGNNNGDFSEWINANSAVSLLDNPVTTGLPQGIPYSFGVGNHDQGPSGDGSPDDTAGYNQYFGASRYSGKSYYGGHYGTDNDNHYELFSAGGMDFIVINIAYMDPGSDGAELTSVLDWANGLLQANSTRRGIVASHYLINEGFNASWSDQGLATYNALSGNPNLFLMLAGHWTPPEGQRTDVSNGNRVFTFLSDYQEDGFGGDGWLRILTFVPSSNQIQVQTYSPFINQSENSPSGHFTVNYDMHGNGNNFTLLASKPAVLSGTTATFTWPSLSPGSKYEWYATVSNSTGTAVGPLWSFTTGGPPPVTLSPTSLTFPSQLVNTTSAAQSVTLTNSGNSTLNISSIAASAQYSQTNTCGGSVGIGANCTINVTFTPTAAGSQPGTITITDNATGSPQTVTLSGTGIAPAASFAPTTLSFGNQNLNTTSAAQSVTLTNSGAATLNITSIAASAPYSQTNTCPASIAAGAHCSISVTFTPTATGSQPGTITVTDNATGSPQTVVLSGTGVPASISIAPTTLSFGNQNLNTTSAAQSVTLTNSGTGTLNITSIVASAQYSQTNTCPASIAAGANCSISVTFTPTAAGSQPGTITVTDNATGSPQTVALSGTGIAPVAGFAPTSLTFGNQILNTASAAQTVTLTNSGNAALTITSIVASAPYAQTNTCGASVAAGANCSISVTFTPTATGSQPGTITVTDNATGSPQTVALSGTGIAPSASFVPTTLPFGNQNVNSTSAAQTLTLTNGGTAALTITSIAASAPYAQTNTCGASLAAGANCSINVTFTPTATGSQPGTITVTDNATGSPQTVALSGTGIAPSANFAPTTLPFGNQNVNSTSAAQTVTLTNSGTAALNITSIVASAPYAQTNTCPASLAAGANCSINVTFTPTATGSQPGTITVTDDATGSPQTVTLSGTGIAPAASFAPTTVTFGNQNVNATSAAQTVTLTNSGTGALTITSIVASAPYAQTNTCGASLAAGANCSINVTFTPTAAGSLPGTITVTDNATGSPQTINLTGTGVAPSTSFAPTSLAFGNQNVNTTSAAQTVTLTNSGTAALNITSIVASAPYAQTNTCGASVAAGANCSISVTFTPTATGSQPGTITVTDNATGSPQTVTLSGTGIAPSTSFAPTSLAFGNQNLNTTSAAQTVTLTNSGTGALIITSIVASAPYAQTNTCAASVAAGANCSINVTFTPTATGSQPGTITVTDNATGSPQTVALSGTGIAPGTSFAPTSLTFGNQNLNTTSAAQTVTLTNSGTAALNITSIAASAQYAQTNTCGASLAASANCSINVTFTPTATGSQPGTITVTDNATGSPQTVALSGTGIAPGASFAPTSLAFGNQNVNTTSAAQTVTLTNSGTAALNITTIVVSAPYAQTNTCPASVAAGANCSINVTFTPTAAGSQPGAITVTDDATGSPQTVTLSGTGIAPAASFAPTTLTFGNQNVNTTSAAQTVTLTN